MLIYNYDSVTKQFTYPEEADENPKVKGAFLIPANATGMPPPAMKPGEVAVWKDDRWGVVTDKPASAPSKQISHRFAMVKDGRVISVIDVIGEIIWSTTEDVFMINDPRGQAKIGMKFDGVKYAVDAD